MTGDWNPMAQSATGPHDEGTLPLRVMKLGPGESTAMHVHDCSEVVYVTSGSVMATRGAGEAVLETTASAYFPKGVPHKLVAGDQGATVLVCHVLKQGQAGAATAEHVSDENTDISNPNVIRGADLAFRWALLEEFEPWKAVEPTKGNRIRLRYLFTPDRGAPDAVVGIASVSPHSHYTLHHHEPAEVYHVLEGSGTIHVSGEAVNATPGQSVFVPADAVHGIDTEHSSLRLLWLYNLVEVGTDWTWRAVEPIWDKPKPACCYGD